MTSSNALSVCRRAFAHLGVLLVVPAVVGIGSLLLFACATGTLGAEDLGDGGTTPDAGPDTSIRFDANPPDEDSGSSEEDAGDGGGSSGCTRRVVINELAPSASAGAAVEFIELYNAGTCAAPMGGWKLPYKSKTGTGNTVLFNFDPGASIPAKSFLVLGTPTFSGKKDGTMTVGMADEGQVALVDDQDKVIDSVAYGAATGQYVEGSPAPAPPANGSIGRKTDGVDTNNNNADFKTFPTHSAGTGN